MKERHRLKKELLKEKEPEIDDLGSFQLIQIAKEAKLGDSMSGKHTLERNLRLWMDNFC